MKKHLLMIAALGLVLFGCGDDVTKTTVVEGSGISQLAAGEEFPKCTEENGGETLYAADSGKAYICTGKAWTPLHGESSADTVVVRDTLVQKDSVFLSQTDTVEISNVDTLILRDTLFDLNGKSCTAEILEDGSGYKILCGGDSVGVVLNGEMGDDGESCTVADSGNVVVTVQCAADTVKLYKALCGTTPYDPSESFCYNGGAKDTIVTLCDSKTYDLGESFCYNGGAKDSVVTLCGGKSYELSVFECRNDTLYFTDSRDNQEYRAVVIGTQIWMAENLNYRYTQGTADLDSSSFCYDGNASNCTKYGRLYTWSAAMDSAAVFSTDGSGCGNGKTCSATEPVRGVCPEGWHLPSYDEMNILLTAVGGGAGKKLKATSSWNDILSGGGNGTDAYGFSALPAGGRHSDGDFSGADNYAGFWSAAEYDADRARYMYLSSDEYARLGVLRKDDAFSVRCLSDRLPAVR